MSKVSLVKGGKIVAGKSNGKKNGAGTFIPYNKAKKGYDDSQSVRLGTSGIQDTSKSLVNTYQSNNPNVQKSEMGTPLISSQQGKKLVTTADQTMDNLAPITALPNSPVSEGGQTSGTTPTTDKTTTTPETADNANDYVTYINEQTGQEMTLKGPALTEQAKADALKKGYVEASSEISGVKTTPEMAKLQREVDSATRETDTFMSRLESMLITDKELKGEISQISAKYKARQNEMRDINERRQVAMETLGIRTGARYTGGSGGIMGGILSEEERQGLMRIESIENDKQDAILAAKKAARDQNFTLYTTLAQKAEKMQEKKATELQALKKAQAEQDAKIAEEKKQAEYDALIAEQLAASNTDPTKLFQSLGGKVPYDKILEVAKLLPKAPEDFTLSEGQKRFDAKGNLIASVAKTYAPKTVPDGMTPGQVSAFNGIVSKYNASPLIAASDRTIVLKNSIKDAREKPDDGATQLNLVYSYIQALDTYQSAVREGELGLVNSIDSKIGKVENWKEQILNGQIVRPEVTKEIADAAENLVSTIDKGAQNKAKSFESQANVVGLGSQWKQYTQGFTQSYAGEVPSYTDVTNAELLGTTEDMFTDPNDIYTTP